MIKCVNVLFGAIKNNTYIVNYKVFTKTKNSKDLKYYAKLT
jgi:hypothetical protein